MTVSDFTAEQFPVPQQWFRKHHFGDGNYETLAVFYMRERVYEGQLLPRILRCVMFGTLAPQEKVSAPNVETGKAILDAHFSGRFPEHQCNEGCTGWSKGSGGDTPFDEEPVTYTVQ